MGKLISRIPKLLVSKHWDNNEFVGRCQIAGISSATAYRLLRGETGMKTDTLERLAAVLGVNSISEIIELEPGATAMES